MRLFRSVSNKIKCVFYKTTSKRRKALFDNGKIDNYQYMDEVYTKDKEAYEWLLHKNSYRKNVWQEYWDSQEIWSVKNYFPKTFDMAKKLVFEEFLSLYEVKPDLMDIGCASGEWSLMVAPYCERVCGYEYSQKMVNTANREAQKMGVKNVEFYQAEAATMDLSARYDGGMILAMLMYIDDKDRIAGILHNVYSHLKPGAFLCTRDSLNDEGVDVLYLLNKRNGYTAFYWSKDLYYEQFKIAGFEMKKEVILEKVTSRQLSFIHVGNIWQKPLLSERKDTVNS